MIIAKNDLNDLGQSFHSRETARETLHYTALPQRDLEAFLSLSLSGSYLQTDNRLVIRLTLY